MPLSDVERFAELVEDRPLHAQSDQDGTGGETGQLLALVCVLRDLDFAVGPSELTRQRQRQRLVAMAAVRTPDGAAQQAEAGRHRVRHAAAISESVGVWSSLMARLQRAAHGRRLIAGVAGLSVIVAALGVLALLAQSAIPGETLYGLKRGTEQARLALAGAGQAEGRVLLGFASTRLGEIDQLLDEPVVVNSSGSGIQAADGGAADELLVATLDTMDRQTTAGTNALTSAAVDTGSLPTLQFIGKWGIDQFETLDLLTDRLPEDARSRAGESKNLLQRVVQRLEILAQAIGCECFDVSNADELGPLPCPSCSDSENPGSPSASGPTGASRTGGGPTTSGSTTTGPTVSTAPRTSAAPLPGSSSPAPPPVPDPDQPPTVTQPAPLPLPLPVPIPIPIPIPIPTQSSTSSQPSPPPPPPPPGGPEEGEPCVLIGFLGIQIPGIIIGGICVGLGG